MDTKVWLVATGFYTLPTNFAVKLLKWDYRIVRWYKTSVIALNNPARPWSTLLHFPGLAEFS